MSAKKNFCEEDIIRSWGDGINTVPLYHFRLISHDFKEIFTSDGQNKQFYTNQLKEKLDGLITGSKKVYIDYHDYHKPEVSESVLYYITGFLVHKLLKKIDCNLCRKGLKFELANIPQPYLINLKNTKFLIISKQEYNSTFVCMLKMFLCNLFIQIRSTNEEVYQETILVVENYKFQFPCAEHKIIIFSYVINEFIVMRIRQYYHMQQIRMQKISEKIQSYA